MVTDRRLRGDRKGGGVRYWHQLQPALNSWTGKLEAVCTSVESIVYPLLAVVVVLAIC